MNPGYAQREAAMKWMISRQATGGRGGGKGGGRGSRGIFAICYPLAISQKMLTAL